MAASVLAIGIPSLINPFGFDQANQAHIAGRILEGDVLFRDVVSLKPALTIWFHAASLWLLGHTMMAIRIADLVWVLLVSFLIYRLAIQAIPEQGSRVGWLAGIFYACYYYSHTFWHTAQADGWLNLPVTLAFLLILRSEETDRITLSRRFFLWAAVGGSAACAVLFKYTALGIVAVMALYALAAFRHGRRSGLVSAVGFLAGLAITGTLLIIWLWASGAIQPFLQSHFPGVISYGSGKVTGTSGGAGTWLDLIRRVLPRIFNSVPLGERFLAAPRAFWLGLAGLATAVFGLWRARKNRRQLAPVLMILAWLGAAWVSTAVQGRWFPYHFLPLLPPLALLAGRFVVSAEAALAKTFSSRNLAALCVGGVVAAAVLAGPRPHAVGFISFRDQYARLFRVLSGGASVSSLWKSGLYDVAGNYSVSETVEVAEYLKDRTRPQDTMFLWGTNLGIRFLAPRPRVTGIDTSIQAVGQVIAGGGGLERLTADLTANPPEIFVIQKGDQVPHILGHVRDSYALLLESPALLEFVAKHYGEKTTIGHFIILGKR